MPIKPNDTVKHATKIFFFFPKMTNSNGLYLNYEETLEYLAYLLLNEDKNTYTIAKVLTYATRRDWGDIYYTWKNNNAFLFKEINNIKPENIEIIPREI